MKRTKLTPWTGIVEGFREQLLADGKSQNTVNTYMYAVVQFFKFHKDLNSVNDITQASVNKWLSSFNPRKATLNLKKNVLKSLLDFLKTEYRFKKEIQINIKDLPRPEPQFLTIPEQDKLLQFARGLGETSQYYVMIKLMLFTGMRISEVTNLKFMDIEGSQITLSQTKHGSVKRRHLKEEIAKMLKQYINARRNKFPLNKFPSGSQDLLFQTLYAGKFKAYSRLTTNLMIKKLAKSVGITKNISNHSLRHSYAVRFLRNGSLLGLKHMLGHKSIRTVEGYTHLNDEDLIRQIEQL